MPAAEPNAMPSRSDGSPPETFRYSMISFVISNHLRGISFPAFLDEPRQMAIERDRAAVTHPGRAHPDDRASHDLAADAGALRSGFDLQFDSRSGQQAVARFDEGAAGRHVDDPRPMAGPHQRVHDMVVF